jgi:catechol 2,3-dioxygenase-like lactoylglutathione lyase family enzyme
LRGAPPGRAAPIDVALPDGWRRSPLDGAAAPGPPSGVASPEPARLCAGTPAGDVAGGTPAREALVAAAAGAAVVLTDVNEEALRPATDELTAAGHRAHQPPYDAFWGARYAIVDDPDGHPVGLMSPVDERRKSWPPAPPPGASGAPAPGC